MWNRIEIDDLGKDMSQPGWSAFLVTHFREGEADLKYAVHFPTSFDIEGLELELNKKADMLYRNNKAR